jgi:hypothetical protein
MTIKIKITELYIQDTIDSILHLKECLLAILAVLLLCEPDCELHSAFWMQLHMCRKNNQQKHAVLVTL